MKVLIACEFSGIVRDAFIARGHDAISCDLLPSERQGPHYQGDIFDILDDKNYRWDLMIHHSPCTYILNSGCRWLYKHGRGTAIDYDRWAKMVGGALFFRKLQTANIPKICGENPIMVSYAKEIIGGYSQIIHPWQFGHGEMKATCLWLKNLPPLVPTNIVPGREQRIHKMSPGKNRSHERSRTFQGIANAMAEQWG